MLHDINYGMYVSDESSQTMESSWKKVLVKIIMLGESRVGKTGLLNKYVMNKFIDKYKPTIGADFLTTEIIMDDLKNNIKYLLTLQIWDTAGQKRFRSLSNSFYRGADACVLVYDITRPQTLVEIEKLREPFLAQLQSYMEEQQLNSFPFLLLANKCDKKQNLHDDKQMILLLTGYCRRIEKRYDLNTPSGIIQIVQQMMPSDGLLYASKYTNMLFYETSAVDGTNIDIAFRALAAKWLDGYDE